MIIDEWIWVCLFVFVMIAQRSLSIQELRMPTIQISLLITKKKLNTPNTAFDVG